MMTRNQRLIFTTMLFTSLTTTAIACSLIYGMLTGMLPGRTISPQAHSAAASPGDGGRVVRGPGTRPADFRASINTAGGVVLLCRQARTDPSSGRSGVDGPPGGGGLEPLVDRPNHIAPGKGGEQFFF